ncbi:hypothetical protein ABL78_2828 [Leptomonas seymouri]|uniref:Uncharacterized protein n=1 Tax=Leptomonas seymouri TaxID=5684 RepID=A0A0N1PF40_LEPSE|nr:hypothetical protein ABL78_2828 [Leptomonas seymouri]|eukprot:KPI88098.1 hypothetical protein ABL78_2828 [Leptomonas seymouri]
MNDVMPSPRTSESSLSTGSGLSGRYDLESALHASGQQGDSSGQRSATGLNDNNSHDASQSNDKRFSRYSVGIAGSQPPTLQSVHRGSAQKWRAPLLGCSSQDDRTLATDSNAATTTSPLLTNKSKSVPFACSPRMVADNKVGRHRCYAQALQTPLTDTGIVASSPRTIQRSHNDQESYSNSDSLLSLVEMQPTRTGAQRVPVAPTPLASSATTIIATPTRRPCNDRRGSLSNSPGEVDASSTSGAVSARTGSTRTPMGPRKSPLSQAKLVTSVPTYLPNASSQSSRGAAVCPSFPREPLHFGKLVADGAGAPKENILTGTEMASLATCGSVVPRTSPQREEFSSSDSTLVHRHTAVLPVEPREVRPAAPLPDEGSNAEGRDSSARSPTSTTSYNRRVSTSHSGSGVFSMHTLVSRSKNVNNFDYGLSALGFPVEGPKQQPPRPRGVSSGSPGANGSDVSSFWVSPSDVGGVAQGGCCNDSGLEPITTSLNDVTVTTTTHSTLPSLLQNRQSSLQVRQSNSAGASSRSSPPSHSSISVTVNSAQMTPLVSLVRRTSGGVSSAGPAMAIGNAVDALRQQRGRSPSCLNHSVPVGATRVAASGSIPAPSLSSGKRKEEDASGDARPAEINADTTNGAVGAVARSPRKSAPRPPPCGPNDATLLRSSDCVPELRVSSSPSHCYLEETRANRGMAYEGAPLPASFASTTGTLPSSNRSSGALSSVSLRSTILQPRCLPRNLDDTHDLRLASSNDFFVLSKRGGGDAAGGGGSVNSNSSCIARTPGPHAPQPLQPSPGVATPDKGNPRLLGRRAGPLGTPVDEVASELDRDELLAPPLPRNSDNDDDDSLSYEDSDSSNTEGNGEEAHGNTEGSQTCLEGGRDGRSARASRPFVRRSSKSDIKVLVNADRKDTKIFSDRNSDDERVNTHPGRGTTFEKRQQLARTSRETFLPFDAVATVGSRGFSSLLLTSFLRRAGSSETAWTPMSSGVVWSPQLVTSTSSSPPSSMAATMTGISYGSRCASVWSQESVPSACGGAAAADGAAPPNTGAVCDSEPTKPGRCSGSAAAGPSSLSGAQGATSGRGASLREPASLRTPVKRSENLSLLPSVGGSSAVTSEALPRELSREGVLRWAKPFAAVQVECADSSTTTSASRQQGTGESLLRQLELSNHRAWQDARVLSVLEHRTPAPTAATRVFAVDNGYVTRVVQNDLMGDCETDECVERCAATAAHGAADKDDGALPSSQALPSVLVDTAVRRFFEDGENAIVVVMDTAADFTARHAASMTKGNHRLTPSAGVDTKDPNRFKGATNRPNSSRDGVSPLMSTWVARTMCRKVVEAFVAFKGAQSTALPGLISDLKVAVALVPVLPNTSNTSSYPPLSPPPVQSVKAVFYDAVSWASSPQDSSRQLEVATSPIFGTCLNECQWLVVEDESDIQAVFTLLNSLCTELQGQQGFLYVQFLHQCFIPGAATAAVSSTGGGGTSAPRDAAGPARRRSGGCRSAAQLISAPRSCFQDDIVVSSFAVACTPFPQVFEAILDQRADTPWPLLRYALGKGPSTVLGVSRVHEEDEEAAYPLSLLQRMRSIQHPRPRRGSVLTFVAEQRNKMADLKRRLLDAEDRVMRANSTAASRATMKRLSVLISKLECSAKDAEEFLFDPGSAHVPVYVNARRPLVRATNDSPADLQMQLQQHRQPISPSPSPHSSFPPECAPARPCSSASLVGTGEPLLLAMVQHYNPTTDAIAVSAIPIERKGTGKWTMSPRDAVADARRAQRPLPRVLTAWLTLNKSVSFEVDEVTSLNILNDSAAPLPVCETWRCFGMRFHAGYNATAVVVQEREGEDRLWSLRVTLELVHGVLKDTWSPRCSTTATLCTLSSTPPSNEVMRVAVSVYRMSGSMVADLLCDSTTSRATIGSVAFTPATLAFRPLTGAAVPLNVTSQVVESLPQLETVLREAVERLRTAQSNAKNGAAPGGSAAAVLTRESLTAPGYTVTSVELTQRVVQGGCVDDVYVSSLSVIDLGGHFSLLEDAIKAGAALEEAAGSASTSASASAAVGREKGAPLTTLPSVSAMLLARLLVKQRDLVVCAVALPPVPSATSAYGLLGSLKEFQQSAACAPGLSNSRPPGSVRRFMVHLQSLLAETGTQRGIDASSLSNVRSALRHAQAVIVNPRKAAFVPYPYTQSDADTMRLPAVSHPPLDATALRSSPGALAVLERQQEKSSTLPFPPQQDESGTGDHASGRVARRRTGIATGEQQEAAAAPARTSVPRRLGAAAHAGATADTTLCSSVQGTSTPCTGADNTQAERERRSKKEGHNVDVAYYGVQYRGPDRILTQRDVTRFLAQRQGCLPLPQTSAAEKVPSVVRSAEGEEGESEEESEAVLIPSVLVLNASTTSSYVKQHGTSILIPLPSPSGSQFASYASNEIVNIKPTSTGMKSSLLMRVVSCVSRGRTAALLISDTEPCNSASCIAWLTLRTVMGGVFQSLRMKEAEGVRHCAVLRAFLIEEKRENEFADLLAPQLTAVQPRHVLTRLKHSPFCGPLPANATSLPVKDLHDVNVALSSVLAAALLAHQATAAEPLRGAIVLQLTFHQFIPATADQPADVVVSSLWCVQMGCSAGWIEAIHLEPSSATGTLLQYWMGGPCYTTTIVGLSRFRGVRMATWKELLDVQRQLREVPLRLPRSGSVQAYIASLQRCLSRAERGAGSSMMPASTDDAKPAEDKKTSASMAPTSTSSSARSSPINIEKIGKGISSGAAKNADSLMRVTALLREAQRLVERGPDLGKSAQLPSLLAHEAKTFGDLDEKRGCRS